MTDENEDAQLNVAVPAKLLREFEVERARRGIRFKGVAFAQAMECWLAGVPGQSDAKNVSGMLNFQRPDDSEKNRVTIGDSSTSEGRCQCLLSKLLALKNEALISAITSNLEALAALAATKRAAPDDAAIIDSAVERQAALERGLLDAEKGSNVVATTAKQGGRKGHAPKHTASGGLPRKTGS